MGVVDDMKKIIKFLKFSGILFLISIILAGIWYSHLYLQYKQNLDSVLSNSYEEFQTVDSTLYKMAVIAEGEQRIRRWVAQQACWSNVYFEDKSSFNRILEFYIWYVCISLHYDDKQIFRLWCHYSIFVDGYGYGLNNASMKYFGKNTENLSLEQKAAIIVMVRSPDLYRPGSESSKKRVQQLLEKYKNL